MNSSTVISAKELRDNLGELTKRVMAGEHIYVSYRNRPAFKLEPITDTDSRKGKKARYPGLDALIKEQSAIQIAQKYKSGNLKQIYQEEMAKKYGVNKTK